MAFLLKDPRARADYAIDWAAELGGAAIAASFWSLVPAEPDGAAVEAAGFEPGRTEARIGGGVAGHFYALTNVVTLSDGRVEAKSILLRVEEA